MNVFSGTGSKVVKEWTLPSLREKTIAWFLGLWSFIPSHVAAWTKVSSLGAALAGESFFWANACDKKGTKMINTRKDVSRLHLFDMLLSLVVSSSR
jgi:hypothetical protein